MWSLFFLQWGSPLVVSSRGTLLSTWKARSAKFYCFTSRWMDYSFFHSICFTNCSSNWEGWEIRELRAILSLICPQLFTGIRRVAWTFSWTVSVRCELRSVICKPSCEIEENYLNSVILLPCSHLDTHEKITMVKLSKYAFISRSCACNITINKESGTFLVFFSLSH